MLDLGCLLLSPFSAKAAIELSSERLTTADGLANNSVRYIYQDKRGYLDGHNCRFESL